VKYCNKTHTFQEQSPPSEAFNVDKKIPACFQYVCLYINV